MAECGMAGSILPGACPWGQFYCATHSMCTPALSAAASEGAETTLLFSRPRGQLSQLLQVVRRKWGEDLTEILHSRGMRGGRGGVAFLCSSPLACLCAAPAQGQLFQPLFLGT